MPLKINEFACITVDITGWNNENKPLCRLYRGLYRFGNPSYYAIMQFKTTEFIPKTIVIDPQESEKTKQINA